MSFLAMSFRGTQLLDETAGLHARGASEKHSSIKQTLSYARRFLFLNYETALGTALHATPVFQALRNAVPGSYMTVLSSGMPYEVLNNSPYIDNLIETPHPVKEWLSAVWFFLKKVRPHRNLFDCVITDSGNRRSRFQLLSLLTGVRYRVGFEARWNFNHVSIAYDPAKSIVHNNLRLIALLGHVSRDEEPAVFFTEVDVGQVSEFLQLQGILQQRPLVAFQTRTSGGEPNQWFEDRFIELADALYQKTAAQIIFLGAKSEVESIESIRRRMRAPSFSAAGRTSISGLAALLCKCDLLVTLDTGTMHVGRAVRVPMVVIAHGKAPRHEWLPPEAEHIRVLRRTDVDCTPCRTSACLTRECMRRIHAAEVLDAALIHLHMFPPSDQARQRRLSRSLRASERTPRSDWKAYD